MKTSNLMLIGGAALVAYLIFKKDETPYSASTGLAKDEFINPSGYRQSVVPFTVTSTAQDKMLRSEPISTVKQGVDYINRVVSSGGMLNPTSKTIAKGVTATVKSTGKTYTGNIVTLAGQKKPSFIAVTPSKK